MEKHNASKAVEFETVESGDTISWTEDWDSGKRQFVADVVDIETKHYRAELTRPACDKAHLTLDVAKGQSELEMQGGTVDDDGNVSITFVYNVD